jgi:CP family cyanate transporter-like MFS transporter
MRGLALPVFLFAAAVICGSAIGVANVLLPVLVKRDFPDRVALLTGLYTMAICAGAAAAAALTAPLQQGLDGVWSRALAAWAVPAALGVLLLAPMALRPVGPALTARVRVGGLWRDPVALQLTAFMGFCSALAYSVFGWLPSILQARGLDTATAGYVLALSLIGQMVACVLTPHLAMRLPDQSGLNVGLVLVAVWALLGCLFAPLPAVWVLAFVQGLGQGALIAVIMTLIVLRSPSPAVAAGLSGLVQSVGFAMGAAGPLLVGALYDLTGTYVSAGLLFAVLGLGAVMVGLGCGRDRQVQAEASR